MRTVVTKKGKRGSNKTLLYSGLDERMLADVRKLPAIEPATRDIQRGIERKTDIQIVRD